MQRNFFTLILLLSWALAACGGSGPGVSSEANAATQTVASQISQGGVRTTREPGCTVVGSQPTPGPTEQAIIPTPSKEDWSKGPEDAYVTFIEYSDFQ